MISLGMLQQREGDISFGSKAELFEVVDMDLSDISRRRAIADLVVARLRILELSVRIGSAGQELRQLRAEWNALKPVPPALTPAPFVASSAGRTTASNSRSGSLWTSVRRFFAVKPKGAAFTWTIDDLCGQSPLRVSGRIQAVQEWRESGLLTIAGWATPKDSGVAFGEIRLVLTGAASVARQTPTFLRNDVAAALGNPGFASCGFRFVVPMAELGLGSHIIDLVGVRSGGQEMTARIGEIAFV